MVLVYLHSRHAHIVQKNVQVLLAQWHTLLPEQLVVDPRHLRLFRTEVAPVRRGVEVVYGVQKLVPRLFRSSQRIFG